VTDRRALAGTGVKAGDKISFQFGPITNPHSFKPSQPYEISIRTSEYYEVAQQITEGPIVENIVAQSITEYSFDALDDRQLALTTITITWVNTQVYPDDLSLKIGYNATQIQPDNSDPNDAPKCFYSQTVEAICEFIYPNRVDGQPPDDHIMVTNLLDTEV
jgi:hypothetical protein